MMREQGLCQENALDGARRWQSHGKNDIPKIHRMYKEP